jgi:hypothetical protein
MLVTIESKKLINWHIEICLGKHQDSSIFSSLAIPLFNARVLLDHTNRITGIGKILG